MSTTAFSIHQKVMVTLKGSDTEYLRHFDGKAAVITAVLHPAHSATERYLISTPAGQLNCGPHELTDLLDYLGRKPPAKTNQPTLTRQRKRTLLRRLFTRK